MSQWWQGFWAGILLGPTAIALLVTIAESISDQRRHNRSVGR